MKDVSKNMRRTGMLLFRNAFMEALQGEKFMCVVHAAHAAEILLKARIAQEDPLLIFSKLPKADSSKKTLALIDLLEGGRTLSYGELPDRLWATTGIKIERINQYREFGRLRNQIVHFSMANADTLNVLTLHYSLEVLDPLVESFWGKSVINFITKDPGNDGFVGSGLFEDSIRKVFPIDQKLRGLLGEGSRKAWENMQVYREEMDRSKTDKDLEAEWKAWKACEESRDHHANDEQDAQHKQQLEDQVNWKSFLDSF